MIGNLISLINQTPTFASSYHADTIRFQNNIIANGGTIDAFGTNDLAAIDVFVKTAYGGNWQQYLTDCSPLAGDNLNAAVVKLWYPSGKPSKLTLYGFTASNYSRTGGLFPDSDNNGTKQQYADTGIYCDASNGFSLSQAHLSFYSLGGTTVYASDVAEICASSDYTQSLELQIATSDAANGYGYFTVWSGSDSKGYAEWAYPASPSYKGFFVGSRLDNSNIKVYQNANLIGYRSTGNAGSFPGNTAKLWRAEYSSSYITYGARPCGFYSIGSQGIPDAMQSSFNSAVQTLMQSLGRV